MSLCLSVEEFLEPSLLPLFVKVRDPEEPWRVVGTGLKAGQQYDVAKLDGSTVRVRVERITKRWPDGRAMAKFVSLSPHGLSRFFARAAEEDMMEWDPNDFSGGEW